MPLSTDKQSMDAPKLRIYPPSADAPGLDDLQKKLDQLKASADLKFMVGRLCQGRVPERNARALLLLIDHVEAATAGVFVAAAMSADSEDSAEKPERLKLDFTRFGFLGV